MKTLVATRPTGVLRRFETALLSPRSNPWDILGGLIPSHALPPAISEFYFEGVSSSVSRDATDCFDGSRSKMRV
jgi:hypothetical protein